MRGIAGDIWYLEECARHHQRKAIAEVVTSKLSGCDPKPLIPGIEHDASDDVMTTS
ncbi:uncharacterized protein G2W53_041012 [Senna tora]|uniref:Uncharacterized protein n=1 Tax=Senna tora TaxID=362788 RepID=A0A834SEG1_9FABA|nr:uncharacterized protein G2W53_041012 [Senna tora]